MVSTFATTRQTGTRYPTSWWTTCSSACTRCCGCWSAGSTKARSAPRCSEGFRGRGEAAGVRKVVALEPEPRDVLLPADAPVDVVAVHACLQVLDVAGRDHVEHRVHGAGRVFCGVRSALRRDMAWDHRMGDSRAERLVVMHVVVPEVEEPRKLPL